MAVNEVAKKGFNDLEAMETYERARPSYPNDAVDHLFVGSIEKEREKEREKEKEKEKEKEGDKSDSERKSVVRVMDMAAGTGKLTVCLLRLLRERRPLFLRNSVIEIYSVEPADAMRQVWRKSLSSLHPLLPLPPSLPPCHDNFDNKDDVRVYDIIDGTCSNLPFPNDYFDAIFIGQAFHWFSNDESMKEMSRTLRTCGSIGMIWNIEDGSVPWIKTLRDLYEQYDDNIPQYRIMKWRDYLLQENGVTSQLFSPLEESWFSHSRLMSPHLIWERISSKSYIVCLSHDEKNVLKQKVLDLLQQTFPDVQASQESIRLDHSTHVVLLKKK